MIDEKAAKAYVMANYPNDPLLRHIAVTMLDSLPKADAVEVVHGQWKEWWPGISLIMTGEEMLYRCSFCDAKYPDIDGYRYCPNCGAKMDLEV